MENQVFKTTAILEDGRYQHFGIHPMTCNLFGHKKEEIVELSFQIHEDQTKLNFEVERDSKDADYWGWFDQEKTPPTFSSSLIYPKYFLLNICFPYGIQGSEDKNQGKAYRIKFL